MFGLKMGELLIIFLVILVLFGGTKLPQLGSSLGQAIRNFKKGFGADAGEAQAEAQRTGRARSRRLRTRASTGAALPPRPARTPEAHTRDRALRTLARLGRSAGSPRSVDDLLAVVEPSRMAWYRWVQAFRFTFSVGVSSPDSWVKSWSITWNRLSWL